MPDISPERVAAIAEAARVDIEPSSAKRIAAAVSPAVKRLAAAALNIPLEAEPSSFQAVQQREAAR